jgi:hypothetical protein
MDVLIWVAIVVGIVAALLSSGGQKEVTNDSGRRERQRPSIGVAMLGAFLLGRSMD